MNGKKAMVAAFVGLVMTTGLMTAEGAVSTTDNATRPNGQFLVKALGLTADQASQLQPMFQQHVAAMKAERERFEGQVNGILTPDQQAKFKDLMQKRARHMKQTFGRARRWGGGPAGALRQLNLSADQQAQVKTIVQETRAKLAAAAPGDNTTRRQIRQDMKAQMAKVLTPEQMNQLKQMHQNRRQGEGCNNQQGQ